MSSATRITVVYNFKNVVDPVCIRHVASIPFDKISERALALLEEEMRAAMPHAEALQIVDFAKA